MWLTCAAKPTPATSEDSFGNVAPLVIAITPLPLDQRLRRVRCSDCNYFMPSASQWRRADRANGASFTAQLWFVWERSGLFERFVWTLWEVAYPPRIPPIVDTVCRFRSLWRLQWAVGHCLPRLQSSPSVTFDEEWNPGRTRAWLVVRRESAFTNNPTKYYEAS